jgi:hypothetical protein
MPRLGKNVKMDKMLSRPNKIFPNINGLIKKIGDK